jgi:thiamine-monophosphate kinase
LGSDAPGEFELIERFFMSTAPRAAGSGVELGIGDDAAVLRLPPGTELVACVDTIVAGVHFPEQSDPRAIGHRALAVNLSDMAAMGAQPAWATLALTMPDADAAWLERFASGLRSLALRHGVALVGGDTTRGPLTISVQLMGHAPTGTALRRGGARAGDLLAVTGTLGDAAAGLALLQGRLAAADETLAQELIRRFEWPTARVEFGLEARGIATAAIDLSDGLAADLPRLAAASKLSARVTLERLPLSAALSRSVPPPRARDWALAGGDDYELLLALPPHSYPRLAAQARDSGTQLTLIGELGQGRGVTWSFNGEEVALSVQGYDHFR